MPYRLNPVRSPRIRAYHGSHHLFDRFDADKIGSGAGSQIYGHGLYFAGSEGTAQHYRDVLRPKGQPLERELALRDKLIQAENVFNRAASGDGGLFSPEEAQQYIGVIEDQLRDARKARRAYVYEVEIDHPESALLDYDGVFEEQSPQVQSVIQELMDSAGDTSRLLKPDQWRGEHFMAQATRHWGHQHPGTWLGDVAAAEALRSRGIPGVKYPDALSRRRGGQPSYNYVIFPGEENRISILARYGILAPLLASSATNQDGIRSDYTTGPLSGLTVN